MNQRTKGILALAAGVAVLGLLGLAALLLARPAPETLQGEADATKVDVAAKVAGRIATIEVKEGDWVKKGDPVATIESPEIRARLDQAEAAKAGAEAQSRKADSGAREEEIRAARSQWDRARHAADLAEVTFGRLERLARDGVVPNQRRDEAEAQWKTSRDAAEAAKALYDMALAGARREDLVERLGRAGERARHPHRLRRVDHPDEPAREEGAVGVDDGDRQAFGEAVPEDRRHEGESGQRKEDEKDEGIPARDELVRLPPGRAAARRGGLPLARRTAARGRREERRRSRAQAALRAQQARERADRGRRRLDDRHRRRPQGQGGRALE